MNKIFSFFPGNGLYVDLDGSTGSAGRMTSTGLLLSPGNYELSFMLGGNSRGAPGDTVNVSVATGFASQSYLLASADPLALRTIAFTVGATSTVNLVFQNLGGDNIGAILDNVQLNSVQTGTVPDGGQTVVLLGMGIMLVGWTRRTMK